MKKTATLLSILFAFVASFQSCTSDKIESGSDRALYELILSGGFTYYQGGNLLSGVAPSPHGSFKLRFNSTAFAVLDSTGELPSGGIFPAGSILVKEIFNGNTLIQYAVMWKDPSNPNAGNGWVWAEFNTEGVAVVSTSRKGDGCIGCHSSPPHRDLTRTFDLH